MAFLPGWQNRINSLPVLTANSEVEFRFYYHDLEKDFNDNRSHELLPGPIFHRLLASYSDLRYERSIVTSGADRNYRRIEYPDRNSIVTEHKIPQFNHLWDNYGIRLAVSTETAVNYTQWSGQQRERQRWSKELITGVARLDLTIVDKDRYQVELEVLNYGNWNQICNLLQELWLKLHRSVLMFNFAERRRVFDFIRNRLNAPATNNSGLLSTRLIMKPRNLHWEDLVWGGITGNAKTDYAVSHKADGETRWLVLIGKALYLIWPPYYCMKLLEVTGNVSEVIAEGEWMPLRETIWLYDCLHYRERRISNFGAQPKNVKDQPFRTRHAMLSVIQAKLGNTNLVVKIKEFTTVLRPDEFFAVCKQLLLVQAMSNNELDFPTDGLIFTPLNVPYQTYTENLALTRDEAISKSGFNPKKDILTDAQEDQIAKNWRVLTHHADICKWKPPEQLTSDFLYRTVNGQIQLLVGKKHNARQFTEWKGTARDPLPQLAIPTEVASGTIIEMGYDADNNQLKYLRSRPDKPLPNRIDRVKDNWYYAFSPISYETLTGQDLKLMRKYHNQVKHYLYRQVLLAQHQGQTLLSIGAGQGGELNKWDHFSKIVAVEPDPVNLKELERRALRRWGAGWTNKMLVLNNYGQNIKTIIDRTKAFLKGAPVNVISSMFSLTFFWDKPQSIVGLAVLVDQLLAADGIFVFATLDGLAVDMAFQDPQGLIQFGEIEERRDDGALIYRYQRRELEDSKQPFLIVDLPDTIVGQQIEYLPRLNDLWSYFEELQLDSVVDQEMSSQQFLNSAELKLTRLYRAGWWKGKADRSTLNWSGVQIFDFAPLDIRSRMSNFNPASPGPLAGVGQMPIFNPASPVAPAMQPMVPMASPPAAVPIAQPMVPMASPPAAQPMPTVPIVPSASSAASVNSNVEVTYFMELQQPILNVGDVKLALMGTIGDGACLLNAFFQATDNRYQNGSVENTGYQFIASTLQQYKDDANATAWVHGQLRQIIDNWAKYLIDSLDQPWRGNATTGTNLTNWQASGLEGKYMDPHPGQTETAEKISKESIIRELQNPRCWKTGSMLQLIATITNSEIILLQTQENVDRLNEVDTFRPPHNYQPFGTVVLYYTGSHYETIAVQGNDGRFYTYFISEYQAALTPLRNYLRMIKG